MSNGKHILILSSWYPTKEKPFLGNFVQQHAQLVSKSTKVTVLNIASSANKSFEIGESLSENLTEISIYFPKGLNKFSRFFNERKAFRMGLNLVKNVDLIHAHVLLSKGYLFARAKKHFNCPLIVTEHSSIYRQDKIQHFSKKDQAIFNSTLKYVDQFIAVSEILKSDLMKSLKITNCKVIGNPVDVEKFVPATKTVDSSSDSADIKRFLHISTLAPIKNVKGIIDAFDLAFEKNNQCRLTIVSDENHDALTKYSSPLNCARSIDFLGPLKHEETVQYYQKSDFFILNSDYETFSIVLAEAWSCGLPVIATNVGIASNMSPELGRSIPKNDMESLSKTILEIQKSDFDSQKIRAHALQFSNEQILAQISTVYEEI